MANKYPTMPGLPGLLVLADFLERFAPEEQFDFSFVAETRDCGTVRCAIGWTTVLWPEVVKDGSFDGRVNVVVNGRDMDYVAAGVAMFGINDDEASDLFSPAEPRDETDRPPWLGADDYRPGRHSSAKQVAKAIRRFHAWKVAGGNYDG